MQELKAAAFAGNPEALAQFSGCQQMDTLEKGLSRAVLVLDAPLVQGMTQVHPSEYAPFQHHWSSALENAKCNLKRGHGF